MNLETHPRQRSNRVGGAKISAGEDRGFPNKRGIDVLADSGGEQPRLGDLIHFLLGISLFAPGFAVITVGHTTGVQSAVILVGLCGIMRFSRGRIQKDIPLFILLAVWAIGLIISVAVGGWKPAQVHAMIGFNICLLIIAVFGLKCEMPRSYDVGLLRGLIAGAVLSTIYALYQQAALRLGLPYGIPPLNNPSFSLFADAADPGMRSFAFFPEPSMLAGYLIPIAVTMIFMATSQRRTTSVRFWIISAFLFVGIVASGSFSVFVAVPTIFGLCLFAHRRGVRGLVKVSLALASTGILLVFLIATSSWATSISENLVARLANASDDPSLIIRFGRDVASFRIFEENPLFGAGVSPDPDVFFASMPTESSRYQSADTLSGGGSLPLDILAGHGILGFSCFVTLIFMALTRSHRNTFLRFTLIGCVVVMTLQCSNIDLYLIWVVMGLCLAQRPNMGIAQSKTPNPSLGHRTISLAN